MRYEKAPVYPGFQIEKDWTCLLSECNIVSVWRLSRILLLSSTNYVIVLSERLLRYLPYLLLSEKRLKVWATSLENIQLYATDWLFENFWS